MTYDVVKCDKVIVDNEEVAGSVSPMRQEIKIQKGYKDSFTDAIFLHEMVHAIAYHAGRGDLYADESVIECFANGLSQVLADNKGIFNN